jgi:GDP-L-fucose synthase
MAVAEKSPQVKAINLGSEEETSIADLAQLVIRACRLRTEVIFDPSKPSGQPRRACDTQLARTLLGFRSEVPLEEGLVRTVDWYRSVGAAA